MLEYKKKMYTCFLDLGMELLKGKWKSMIIFHLDNDEPIRFLELQRRIGKVSQKVLNEQLKALEQEGVVERKIYQEVPPKVEYFLTERGKGLAPALKLLASWTEENYSSDIVDHYTEKEREDIFRK